MDSAQDGQLSLLTYIELADGPTNVKVGITCSPQLEFSIFDRLNFQYSIRELGPKLEKYLEGKFIHVNRSGQSFELTNRRKLITVYPLLLKKKKKKKKKKKLDHCSATPGI